MVYVRKEPIGHFGELHPEVIVRAELGYPIVGFELDLEKALEGKLERIV